MASLSRNRNGSYRVAFTLDVNDRRAIRIGKMKESEADAIRGHVELLVIAKQNGHPLDKATAGWLTRIGERLTRKLVRAGLIEDRAKANDANPALAAFLDNYIAGREDAKPRTIINLKQARERLLAFFAPDRSLVSITAADADKWVVFLRGKCGYAETTTSRTIGMAQQFFTNARRGRLIQENPFEHLKRAPMSNPERAVFVTRDSIERIIAECPTAEWRLIVALARYGGLRIPSELQELKWSDVLWDKNRFLVRSPKTENHVGKATRFVPLFPELLPHFEAAYHATPEGAVYCVPKARDGNANLRTQFLRIIERAGIEPWEKLFVNCRSSRETELARQFPLPLVCRWIGNSVTIAMKHYDQQIDDDFDLAAGVSGAKMARFAPPSPAGKVDEIEGGSENPERCQRIDTRRQLVSVEGYAPQESNL